MYVFKWLTMLGYIPYNADMPWNAPVHVSLTPPIKEQYFFYSCTLFEGHIWLCMPRHIVVMNIAPVIGNNTAVLQNVHHRLWVPSEVVTATYLVLHHSRPIRNELQSGENYDKTHIKGFSSLFSKCKDCLLPKKSKKFHIY